MDGSDLVSESGKLINSHILPSWSGILLVLALLCFANIMSKHIIGTLVHKFTLYYNVNLSTSVNLGGKFHLGGLKCEPWMWLYQNF